MAVTKLSNRERREQYYFLKQFESAMEVPMLALSVTWIVLLVIELVSGLSPLLDTVVTSIWVLFIIEFAIKFVIAPHKLLFLRRSWISVLALLLPALRVFRIARAVRILRFGRALRGLTFARLLTAFNRGLRELQFGMRRYAFGYVLVLTILATILGAAGMYAFERRVNPTLTIGDALWFSAMMITTSGSDYWPKTGEGRILCFLLAVYAFAVFGYITATLASILIGQQRKPIATFSEELQSLQSRIEELNAKLTILVTEKSNES